MGEFLKMKIEVLSINVTKSVIDQLEPLTKNFDMKLHKVLGWCNYLTFSNSKSHPNKMILVETEQGVFKKFRVPRDIISNTDKRSLKFIYDRGSNVCLKFSDVNHMSEYADFLSRVINLAEDSGQFFI